MGNKLIIEWTADSFHVFDSDPRTVNQWPKTKTDLYGVILEYRSKNPKGETEYMESARKKLGF